MGTYVWEGTTVANLGNVDREWRGTQLPIPYSQKITKHLDKKVNDGACLQLDKQKTYYVEPRLGKVRRQEPTVFGDLLDKSAVSLGPLLIFSIGPLIFLSILSLATILERLWFWTRIMTKEKEIVDRVLEAATQNWEAATEIAQQVRKQPIGRFLYAPLRLSAPDPELFKLALEASADEELASMRKGDKVLEAVITLAPLLGLLGTVVGLIEALSHIRLGDIATQGTEKVTLGIGESLICTALGLVVAIGSLAFYRLFQAFFSNQVKLFRKAGNDLELLYRQEWPKRADKSYVRKKNIEDFDKTQT